jgi:hypothetical protein
MRASVAKKLGSVAIATLCRMPTPVPTEHVIQSLQILKGDFVRTKIVDVLRRAVGTKHIAERLDRVERQLRAVGGESMPLHGDLETLPGTEYSRYAIPVEYPPSRAFAPRYGYSHGKIEALEK